MSYQVNPQTLKAIDLSGLSKINPHSFDDGIDIRITPANGGTVVSVAPASSVGHRPDIYVISNKDDLGTELGKIITLVCLKQS